MTEQSSELIWEEFIKRYYFEQLLSLAGEYPERKSLIVDYLDIEKYNIELAYELLEKPDTVLQHTDGALSNIDLPMDVTLDDAHVRIINLPSKVDIRQLRSDNISKLISVVGIIRKATEVRPKLTTAAFECQKCGHITNLPQSGSKFATPFECDNEQCGRQGPFKLLVKESTFIDAQKLRIQESPEDLRGGEQPQTLDVDIEDDLVGQVAPGDRVTISGTLKSFQREKGMVKSTFFDLVLDGLSIEREDHEFDEIEITLEDEKEIEELGNSPDVYDRIIGSIAPSIFGYDEIKEAMALQLFSGVPKNLPDGSRIRGDIHMLLVGDPGIAKSQLLRYAIKLSPRGIYTSGKGTTSAGLTATAVKDEFGDGRWTLEAGALVLADKGMAAVDEMDKMAKEDRSALHEAMEQQTISIAKAGILATLKSRCALLGAANPKFGRFDRYENIAQQINLPPALISRFDLIFILTDETNTQRDTNIAEHILRGHFAGEIDAQYKNVQSSKITLEQIETAMETIKPSIQPEMIRKYIAYSKRHIFPILEDDSRQMIINFYLNLRNQGSDKNSPIPVTARQLEALVRLAEASARMRLSNIITTTDVNRIIRIVTESLKQVMTDPETGKLDADIISTGMAKSQRDKAKLIRDIIREIQQDHDGKAPKTEVIQRAMEAGMDEDKADEFIKRLKREGSIFEPTNGFLKTT
ncbi:MAG: minichromosome maintenance protein MCM [ANME-2 cluster archaeon]|nr:minichromosome maintenance protein MCM [ANME-2 cluster archaeon]